MTKISIYGSGMFGFALTKHFGDKYKDNKHYNIVSYDRNKDVVDYINETRHHPYHFPHTKLDDKNIITNDIYSCISDADILILAIPSQSIRSVIRNLKNHIGKDIIIINTAKALECETNKRLSEVINEELSGIESTYTLAHFSGGTIAEDIVNGAPLGADIACEDIETCKMLQDLFSNENLRVYGNTDMIGIEYAGAFKNVIAILAGIANGMGLPYGSETHLISRAAKEAKDIAVRLGAKEESFSMENQAWGNDLWMSCTGNTRNRYFGKLIGEGMTSEEALQTLENEHKIAEGYNTAKVIPGLCEKIDYNSIILTQMYEVVHCDHTCESMIEKIMAEELETIYFN